MKFSYKFSNLLGAVYQRGNLEFLPDGFRVVSPVGNRVSIFDIKNSKSETLPIEGHLNFSAIAISPDGCLLIMVNEEGEGFLCSMVTMSVISTYHFHQKVNCIKFSPDGKKFAVTRDTVVLVFHTPGKVRVFNPFLLYRTFTGAFDETTCIDWSSDSKVLLVGSKDMNTRVYATQAYENLAVHSMAGHLDVVVGAFFENNSMNVYSASRRGHLNVWECNLNTADLIPKIKRVQKKKGECTLTSGQDDDGDSSMEDESGDCEMEVQKVRYKRVSKHAFRPEKSCDETHLPDLTCCAFHKQSHIFVSAFSNGVFTIHEMPDFNLIHSLSIAEDSCSSRPISAVSFNRLGDLIAIGCAELGQLLVWEWQSQQQVLKQQSHYGHMSAVAYSGNGQNIATGGVDGKVKVWDTGCGFSFVTFHDHTAGVTGLAFVQRDKGDKVIVSCSLDGTVRAFDLKRYRNFATLTGPRAVQFSCLAIDPFGLMVCAGCQDMFSVFVWSMDTKQLLMELSDHTAPVHSLAFSKQSKDRSGSILLASGSWDKTVKLWDVFDNRGSKETIQLHTEVLALDFRFDDKELAVATADAQISFWDPIGARQVGSISGRHDLGYGRRDTDTVTGKQLAASKMFQTLCYSADGKMILAAGESRNVCIYSTQHHILMKKFEITCNHSLDGMEEILDRRKMTEWGNINLVDEGQGRQLALPGVREGNFSARGFKPQVRVMQVAFSPSGEEWAAATTEGSLIYSLSQHVVFDPIDLEPDITPSQVRTLLVRGEYAESLLLALRLNEENVIQEVLETTPKDHIDVISEGMPERFVGRLLAWLSREVNVTRHLDFYVQWINSLLLHHGRNLKGRAGSMLPMWRTLSKNLERRRQELATVVDFNTYTIQYLVQQVKARLGRKRRADSQDDGEGDSDLDLDRIVNFGICGESEDQTAECH